MNTSEYTTALEILLHDITDQSAHVRAHAALDAMLAVPSYHHLAVLRGIYHVEPETDGEDA